MDLPLLAQVALLLVAAAGAVPVLAVVVMASLIPFMRDARRAEAHTCLDKLIRFTKGDRSRLSRLVGALLQRQPDPPP